VDRALFIVDCRSGLARQKLAAGRVEATSLYGLAGD